MQVVRMKAERREALGRNRVAQLRNQGWLPAVVYGEGKEALSIAISEWEMEQHIKAHHRIFQLDIAGQAQAALLQEVTWLNTSDRPQHADFKRIDLNKPIEVQVEVALSGHPVGLAKGGTLMKDHVAITVRCLPTAIPDAIPHDVSKLELDQYVTAGELKMPAGVTLVTPPTTSVCHVAKLVVQELPTAPVAEAAPAADKAAGDKAADKPAAEKAGDKK
jgi:large subunit ribosomal protein L25